MAVNNRDKTRIKYSTHVLAKTKEREPIKGMIRDISPNSIYLSIIPAFAIDEEVSLEIAILGKESHLCEVSASVIRKDHDGIALSFIRPLEWAVAYFYIFSST